MMMVEVSHILFDVHVMDAKFPACFRSSSRRHMGFAKRTNTMCSYLSLNILCLRLLCLLASGVENAMLMRSAEADAPSIEATTADIKVVRTRGEAAMLIAAMFTDVSSKESRTFPSARRTFNLDSVLAPLALPLYFSKAKSRLKRPSSAGTSLKQPLSQSEVYEEATVVAA